MNKYYLKYKKIVIGIIAVIIVVSGIKIGYACTYVGDIVVTYPWDEFTLSEKIASSLRGYGDHMTKQELYDKKLIREDQKIFQKFNDSHYKK